MTHRLHATVADLVALAVALDADERRPRAVVRERNRRIAAAHPHLPDDHPAAATLLWLDAVAAEDASIRDLRERVQSALHVCGFCIGGLGLVLGWLAALAAFYYDGSGRVNVIAVLAVLVGVPLLLLLLFLVAALPRRALSWLPGGPAWIALARGLSPGRLARVGLRFVPRETRDALATLWARAGGHQRVYARVQKWMLLRWSQLGAVGFQAGALAAALALVSFTDLVFGWSTTLTTGDPATDAARVHAITSTIAAPWAWTMEDAVPTLELIRDSRYYRAVDASVSAEVAARLGGWWRFVVMAMLVYGLLPRIVLFIGVGRRLRAAVDVAFVTTPGASGVVRQLHAARIETAATTAETGTDAMGPRDEARSAAVGRPPRAPHGFQMVINWSDAPTNDEVLRRELGDVPVRQAGGGRAPADDRRVVASVRSGTAADATAVAILVKAWEPPLLEFIDFVEALRRKLGDGAAIIVFPLVRDERGAPVEHAAAHLEVWRRKLGQVGDPWLRVAELGTEVRS